MTIQGLPTSFADVAYADLINLSTPWTTGATADRENALQYARIYMSRTYKFNFDIDNPPDIVKTANSILANYHLTEDLFRTSRNAAPAKGLKSNKVDADGVLVEKHYDTNRSNSWIDPFPEVTAMLLVDGVCSLGKSQGGISFAPLVRR